MKDSSANIIYVGKAKNLKSRVSSYFTAGDQPIKTRALVQQISDFEVIVTTTEVEALLAERSMIKHHRPKFNILLRDDKDFPLLRVDLNENWPRIEKVRRRKNDGATYLGPFSNAGLLNTMLSMTKKIFPLVRCSRYEFKNTKRPCNYYSMKLCLAPCTLPVDRSTYIAIVKDSLDFLRGKNNELKKSIQEKMRKASDEHNFELAATFRDQLKAFETVTAKQSVVAQNVESADAIGIATEGNRILFQVLCIRDGHLTGAHNYTIEDYLESPGDALIKFIVQFYDERYVPREILLPCTLNENDPIDITESLEDVTTAILNDNLMQENLKILTPKKGIKRDLTKMAYNNAIMNLKEQNASLKKQKTELSLLQEKLGLVNFPKRIECIDISNIQGTAIVASNVCFINGKPANELYRHYKLSELSAGPDDFESIYQVVKRRIRRAEENFDEPDLLVIDGGKGQLKAALRAAKELDADFAIVSLAKSRALKSSNHGTDRFSQRTSERVFLPDRDEPIPLIPGNSSYRILTAIRDEAHRFAITHHRKVRKKVLQGSILDEIPGIGTTLRQRLLVQFEGLEGLKKASLDQLRRVKGMRESTAVSLYAYLQGIQEGKDSAR